MANEIKIPYLTGQANVTANLFTAALVSRQADIACTENGSSGIYEGSPTVIVPGDIIRGYHVGVCIGTEVYEPKAALVTTVDTVETADSVIDLIKGSGDDDEYINMIISIRDVSGGVVASRRILDYVGADKRVTLDFDTEFAIAPGDEVTIWANAYEDFSGPSASEITASVWNATQSEFVAPGTTGAKQSQINPLMR